MNVCYWGVVAIIAPLIIFSINFFFPTTESSGSSTSDFYFRAGTDADVNTKYISQDFTIEALATSKIYIDGSSSVKCDSNPNILNEGYEEISNEKYQSFLMNINASKIKKILDNKRKRLL